MKDGIIVEPNDVKKILAEKFGVPEANVIKAQYSYIITKEGEVKGNDCKQRSR